MRRTLLRVSFGVWDLLQIRGLLHQGAAANIAFVPISLGGRCISSHAAIIHPSDIDIPIIYENDKLLAINKPPHIPHHDDPSTGQLGVMSLIRFQQQQTNPTFPYPHRLYGVHRLDRVTSGILLLAKDSATASALMNKFRRKEISKFYMAISSKKPKKKKQGWVKGMMTKGRRGSYKLLNNSNQSKVNAKEGESEEIGDDIDPINRSDSNVSKTNKIVYAETRFFTSGLGNLLLAPSLLGSIRGNHDDDIQPIPKTAILFQPLTGKTHQLRVAAKSVAIPILGDVRYGGGRMDITRGDDLDEGTIDDWNRAYLHASAIHFQLDEDEYTIWSPPPFDHLFLTAELNDVFVRLMEKHCDCPPVLDAIYKVATDQGNV
mmetsp:Transcript_11648/g.25526  ORF Transcript_11648/g.25526 Transcript_11648/m.25526 type:complete len:375 (-) Transcript_11648:141-1265(-)